MKTSDIIKGPNKEYVVPLEEILSWYPGDYMFECSCPRDSYYHICQPIATQWQNVLDIVRYDDRYYDIMDSVRTYGLVGPLRAKITQNDHVVLLDGHNRTGVSLDLALRDIPVYVGDKDADPHDLVAPDSHWWQKGQNPWINI